jgi:hypothetical protein
MDIEESLLCLARCAVESLFHGGEFCLDPLKGGEHLLGLVALVYVDELALCVKRYRNRDDRHGIVRVVVSDATARLARPGAVSGQPGEIGERIWDTVLVGRLSSRACQR